MPSVCAVKGCGNISNKNPELSYHIFPRNFRTSNPTPGDKRWLKFCKRDDINPKHARICEVHFKQEDYERDLEHELLGLPPRKKLKPDAVPSIYLNDGDECGQSAAQKRREERMEVKRRKELVNELLANSEREEKALLNQIQSQAPGPPVRRRWGPNGCLICGTRKCKSIQKLNEKGTSQPANAVANQLYAIFVLRHVLDLPPDKVGQYLRQKGNPVEWFGLCSSCHRTIEKVKHLHDQVLQLTSELKNLKEHIIQAVHRSKRGDEYKSRWALPNAKIQSVIEDSRQFVFKHDYSHLTTENPFIIGDAIAEEMTLDVNKILGKIHPIVVSETFEKMKTRIEMLKQLKVCVIPAEPEVVVKQEIEDIPEINEDADDNFLSEACGNRKEALKKKPKARNVSKNIDGVRIVPKKTTIVCPFCKLFKSKPMMGAYLCEHLDRCAEAKRMSETSSGQGQQAFLCCPMCINFQCSVKDKCDFGAHLGVCTGTSSEKEIPLKSRIFECKSCEKPKYMKIDAFIRHYTLHKTRPFKCPVCSKRYGSDRFEAMHYSRYHSNPLEDEINDDEQSLQKQPDKKFIWEPAPSEVPWWCHHCSQKFPNEPTRSTHMESEHACINTIKKENIHSCTKCPNQYSCGDELRLHEVLSHVGEDQSLLACDLCGTECTSEKNLRSHRIVEHNLDHYMCDQCGSKCLSAESLNSHLKRFHQEEIKVTEKKFLCATCGRSFSSPPNLRQHVKVVHDKNYALQCKICGNKQSGKSGLNKHMARAHGVGTRFRYACPEPGCGKVFLYKTTLEDHITVHKGEPRYKCQFCQKEFFFRDKLHRHELIHQDAGSRRFKCELCPKTFVRKDLFDSHQKAHATGSRTRTRTFSCSDCSKVFESLYLLRDHFAGTGHKPKNKKPVVGSSAADPSVVSSQVCHICGKSFSTKLGLYSHVRAIHERRYQLDCDICGTKVPDLTRLRIHKARAHQIRDSNVPLSEFACLKEGCTKVFYTKGGLQCHMDQHNEQPRFKCAHCGKGFYFQTKLRIHEQLHTNKDTRPFKCDVCGKGFPVAGYLWLHMKTHKKAQDDVSHAGDVLQPLEARKSPQ